MKPSLIKTPLGILAAAVLALSAGVATAGWHPGETHRYSREVDVRQDRQHERIRAGRHDGSLTRAEFRDLTREQREIRALERHFSADGMLDAREFRRLDRALDRASGNIRAARDDRERRGGDAPYSRLARGR